MLEYTFIITASVIGILIGYQTSHWVKKRRQIRKMEAIETDAARIIADAKQQSEAIVKEAKLEAQDRLLKMKNDFELSLIHI